MTTVGTISAMNCRCSRTLMIASYRDMGLTIGGWRPARSDVLRRPRVTDSHLDAMLHRTQ
jgi:hypothetical protein